MQSHDPDASRCLATAKSTGRQCRRLAQQNGYCGVHNPNVPRCLGTAKNGQPCGRVEGLDENDYCHYHRDQRLPEQRQHRAPQQHQTEGFFLSARRCLGVAASTGRRCKIDWEIFSNGYCKYHQPQYRPEFHRPLPGAAWRPFRRQ